MRRISSARARPSGLLPDSFMVSNHSGAPLRIARALPDETATAALGRELAGGVQPGMVIYLSGDLGAGKTTLTRALLRAAGVTGSIKSPTFTLVELYTVSRLYFYHFDFYRFKSSEEWEEAGLREYFGGPAVCLIEWPEKAAAHLPSPDVRITMEIDGTGRRVTMTATTEAGKNCLTRLQH